MKMTKIYSAMTSTLLSITLLSGLSYIIEIQVAVVTTMEHQVMYVTIATKSL